MEKVRVIPWNDVVDSWDLPNRNWLAPSISVKSAGEYEKAMLDQGEPVDPQEIHRLTEAVQMHLQRDYLVLSVSG
ncbi:MAG: hypothetical protein NZM26_01295 [Patescibacteria group bacterium]|nr:hypothetical protein [Patescibacteria group bacterium]